MGSALKKSIIPPLAIGLIVIALISFAIVKFMSGGGNDTEASLKTPPPRPNARDFGPIPSEHIIGGRGKPEDSSK